MPEKRTRKKATKAKRQGKSGSTQGGEYVREEIHHVREGKHGARSTKQAIAIGLSKARRAGVKVPTPKGKAAKKRARQETARRGRKPSATRARASSKALKREGHSAGSKKAVSRQAKTAARKRTAAQRSASAKKAARTRARKR
jgi:hypothetical protein